MALKLRKDIKKSSYYVWFLGAKESKGLRGSEYILPVINHLEEREKDVEPFKVTLQVSHKGLKIIQNIVSQGQKNSKPKNETIKHFIPHNTITCVYQHEDIIACILLLFNPVTKCPLHVHAYRCDSLETATLLKNQLQTLIERPENQKKFAEIESRLKPQKEPKKVESSIGSDTGTSTRESESSEERFTVENTRVNTLYDSVAAELREKLGKKNSPILLPPRDYDTVHRTKGNLTGIELRRCLNANIVGQNGQKGRRIESSGGSSGIGSDHPPSPDSPEAPDSRFNTIDNHSTSDEDWNGDPTESTLYLMHQPTQMTLPRPSRDKSPEPAQRFSRYSESQTKYEENHRQSKNIREETNKYLEKPIAKYSDNKYLERQKSMEKDKHSGRDKNFERQKSFDQLERDRYSKTIDKNDKYYENGSDKYYYQERMMDSRDKYERYPEGDRFDKYAENSRKYIKDDYSLRRGEKEKPTKYFEDDGFDENMRYRSKSADLDRERSQGYSYDEEEEYFEGKHRHYQDYPVPKTRQKYAGEDNIKYYKEESPKRSSRINSEETRYYKEPEIKPRSFTKSSQNDKFEKMYNRNDRDEKSIRSQEYYEDSTINRKNPQFRQRSPSPEDVKAPRDRFKDAKEKFLLMERERLENERRRPEPPISPVNLKEKQQAYVKRHENMNYSKDHSRYFDDHLNRIEEVRPKPAPRHISEEMRYRERDMRDRDGEAMSRYRHTDKFDPKRRSMFSLIEEEHRKNSNEIAKELKRRSYLEGNHFEDDVDRFGRERDKHFHDLPESDRFMDNFSKSSVDLDRVGELKYDQKFIKNQKLVKNSAGYRHSYAEPKLRMEKNGKKNFSEMLHRTNSSVSNNGRVGIASVHPY